MSVSGGAPILTRMRRGLRLSLAVLTVALVSAAAALAAPDGRFTQAGTVSNVIDGDTLDVMLSSGKRERVRLIGIDAPERGDCYAAQASSRARALAQGKRVVLKGDATQATRDRYGRLLAYVWLPGGKDLGYQLVAGGFAEVYVYDRAFQRLSAYRNAEASAKGATAGQWKGCAAPAPKPTPTPSPVPSPGCHPSYSPCLPITGDLDCADVRALGVAPVRVLGSDPYRLDGDGDGYGCE
jgi:endonuclease YncB( thermonuclease family)